MLPLAGLPTFTIAHEHEVEGSLVAELRVLEVQPIRCACGPGIGFCFDSGGPVPAPRQRPDVQQSEQHAWHARDWTTLCCS